MAIIIKDTDEADKRMTRVFNKILDIFEKEQFTISDVLWVKTLLEWEIKKAYDDNTD